MFEWKLVDSTIFNCFLCVVYGLEKPDSIQIEIELLGLAFFNQRERKLRPGKSTGDY